MPESRQAPENELHFCTQRLTSIWLASILPAVFPFMPNENCGKCEKEEKGAANEYQTQTCKKGFKGQNVSRTCSKNSKDEKYDKGATTKYPTPI